MGSPILNHLALLNGYEALQEGAPADYFPDSPYFLEVHQDQLLKIRETVPVEPTFCFLGLIIVYLNIFLL